MKFDNLIEKTLHGFSYGKSVEDIAKMHNVDVSDIEKQIELGAPKEKEEHGVSLERAKEIAKDHLTENPKYYTDLDKIEKKD